MPRAPHDREIKASESVAVHDDTDDEVKAMTRETDFINHANHLAAERIKLQMMDMTLRKKEEQLSRHKDVIMMRNELKKDGDQSRSNLEMISERSESGDMRLSLKVDCKVSTEMR